MFLINSFHPNPPPKRMTKWNRRRYKYHLYDW